MASGTLIFHGSQVSHDTATLTAKIRPDDGTAVKTIDVPVEPGGQLEANMLQFEQRLIDWLNEHYPGSQVRRPD